MHGGMVTMTEASFWEVGTDTATILEEPGGSLSTHPRTATGA